MLSEQERADLRQALEEIDVEEEQRRAAEARWRAEALHRSRRRDPSQRGEPLRMR